MSDVADHPAGPTQGCPKCQAKLLHVERQGMVVELCSGCRGQWFDPGELTLLIEVYRKLDIGEGRPAGCRCPRCGDAELRELAFPGSRVRIDACEQCGGIWLDAGELELLRRELAALIPPRPEGGDDLRARAAALLDEAERAGELRFACPKCQAKLWHLRRDGNVIELCSGCQGMWFDAGELTVLIGIYRRLEAHDGQPSGVRCVRCETELGELLFPGTEVQIDVCPACRGIWLDRGEYEQLKAHVGTLVDADAPELGERAREILDELDLATKTRAGCPKCGGALGDDRDGGVHVERCAGCGGTWLDSGDLTRVLRVSRRIRLRGADETEVPCIRCPGERLVELPYPGTEVRIDVCRDCRGVWLDRGELEALSAAVWAG